MKNKLLNKQLQRCGLSFDELPGSLEAWQRLLSIIDSTYNLADEDRYLLERSLEISSKEMNERIESNRAMSIQLAQAAKLASLGTLASGVAHELNNPLAVIRTQAELILLRGEHPDELKEKFELFIKLTDRMAGTIRHLLKLSRQSGGKESYSSFSAQAPIESALELIQKQLEIDDIQIEKNFDSDIGQVYGDQGQFEGLVHNLMSNSRDAFLLNESIKERKISIRLKKDEKSKTLIVEFEDTAGGIPKKHLAKVFDPFFTTKEVGQGTGLGLALCRQLVEEMNGEMRVSSKANKGTTFHLEFPLYENQVADAYSIAGSKKKMNHPEIALQRPAVLLIDDEVDICATLADALSDEMEITYLVNPIEGVKKLESQRFDILITDLRMPGLSGIEVVEKARKLQPHISIVVMSGHIGEDLPSELSAIKECLFIEKPFESIQKISQKILNYALKVAKAS